MGDGDQHAQQPVDISTISSIGSLSLTEECKPATVLFDFQGSADNELSVKTGDVLDIVIEHASAGWSLAMLRPSDDTEPGEHGLVPRRFYRFLSPSSVSSRPSTIRLSRPVSKALTSSALFEHGLHERRRTSSSQEDSFNTAREGSRWETISIDGTVFELATPMSSRAEEQGRSDYFGQTSGTVNNESRDSASFEDAALLLEDRAPASLPNTAALPSVIRRAAFPKASLASTPKAAPVDDGSVLPEQGPNLQPLPPVFLKEPPSRRATLDKSMKTVSHKMVERQEQQSRRAYLAGGWIDSGAQEWVTKVDGLERLTTLERRKLGLSEAEGGHEEASDELVIGPDFKWTAEAAPFSASVHTPKVVISDNPRTGYTVYQVTAFLSYDSVITVSRRFSHFVAFEKALRQLCSGLVIPTLPERRILGRLDERFVEQRRKDLERWLYRILRHPVLRSSQPAKTFLFSPEESDTVLQLLSDLKGRTVFTRVFHDEFSIDRDTAQEQGLKVQRVLQVEQESGRIAALEDALKQFRNGSREASKRSEKVSRTLAEFVSHGPECWIGDCDDCAVTRHQLLVASEGFRRLAQAEEADTGPWLPTVELVHEVSRPWAQHEALHDLHQGAVKAWQAIDETDETDRPLTTTVQEGRVALSDRCETVLNVTRAEAERGHQERQEDWRQIASEVISNRIAFHKQALDTVQAAKAKLDAEPSPSELHASKKNQLEELCKSIPRPPLTAASAWSLGDQPTGLLNLGSWMVSSGQQLWQGAVSRFAPAPPSHEDGRKA